MTFVLFTFQDIDFEGFRQFMNILLEIEMPRELVRHLFLSFVRYNPHPQQPQQQQQPQSKANVDGKTLKVRRRAS